jgi:hypothetical protein
MSAFDTSLVWAEAGAKGLLGKRAPASAWRSPPQHSRGTQRPRPELHHVNSVSVANLEDTESLLELEHSSRIEAL